jgi:hypothetical protein
MAATAPLFGGSTRDFHLDEARNTARSSLHQRKMRIKIAKHFSNA